MWVLIWAALLFSLTERATCRKLAAPPTASPWNIIFSPAEITAEKGLCAVISSLTQKPSVLIPPLAEGEPATLTCTAPGICSGTPPHITWTWRGTGDNIRDNTIIQMREDLTIVTTTHFSTLIFTPSAEHHNMMVTCQVTFQKKYQIEETVTLNVTYVKDPQITGNKMVKEDGILDLTCSVDSYPPSDITWSKNGTSAPLQNYTENATLTISNVTREHAGEYVCTVPHLNRTMTASTVVTVMYLPVILPGSGCVDQAEVMTCVCVSQGVPLPLIEWPLLELSTEITTSVLGSSVNSTMSLPVGNHNNTTVECVSRNVVGVVREKLQVTQKGGKQRDISEECGNAVLPWTIAGVSLSVTVALLIYLSTNAYIRIQGKNVKPKEEDSTYISLDKKYTSQEEYEVIARRPR
ncbi:sialic acid-binding Ig-like lectin 5 isoform X3 [Salmo trutta]|uniref:sialic acid-binding Ig-like lectin 5 isoform X3 n=1 Tax=Salmo trutta TaxID=8032 RepID=UPI001131E11D|nr:sialic acid-binding Ig-like lectin 5 isoform X3 [Salmo trutta]XP_029593406.1 sialic acid-binding Ig-like lectin 5 isoform X3 [Salmo trutta]